MFLFVLKSVQKYDYYFIRQNLFWDIAVRGIIFLAVGAIFWRMLRYCKQSKKYNDNDDNTNNGWCSKNFNGGLPEYFPKANCVLQFACCPCCLCCRKIKKMN